MQPSTTSRATVLDTTPATLATGLDHVVRTLLEQDRECAAILATARDALRAVAWNRYAADMTRRSTYRAFIRRHTGRDGHV